MTGQQKNDRILYHQNYGWIEKPVITFQNPDAYQNYLEFFWRKQMPRYCFFLLQSSRYVSNELSYLQTTGLYDDLLLLSSFFFHFFFYFIFSAPISFSLCVLISPSLLYLFDVLSQAFIKHSRKAFVYIHI